MRRAWPDYKSTEELIYGPGGLNEAMQFPGVVNAWTMPIKARIDMLTTGVRTPVGIKVFGADLKEIETIGTSLETILKDVPGTRSVYAERSADARIPARARLRRWQSSQRHQCPFQGLPLYRCSFHLFFR